MITKSLVPKQFKKDRGPPEKGKLNGFLPIPLLHLQAGYCFEKDFYFAQTGHKCSFPKDTT